MHFIARSISDLGEHFYLSPEHWLSNQKAASLSGKRLLGDIVAVISDSATPPPDARFVLDTNSAREGLLELPILGTEASLRTSQKRVAREGDVIFSRLRPYLRQVALLPPGISKLLGQDKFYCSTEFYVFRSLTTMDLGGVVAWLLSPPIQNLVAEAATGGHHPRISVDLLLSAPLEEKYLDPVFAASVSGLFTRHLADQRQLNILLRH